MILNESLIIEWRVYLFIDDLVIRDNIDSIKKFKRRVKYGFEMSGIGKHNYFLGYEFFYIIKGVLHQNNCIKIIALMMCMKICWASENANSCAL